MLESGIAEADHCVCELVEVFSEAGAYAYGVVAAYRGADFVLTYPAGAFAVAAPPSVVLRASPEGPVVMDEPSVANCQAVRRQCSGGGQDEACQQY